MDSKSLQTNTIEKGSKFQIKMRIHFHESIQQPIMAFTFKNIQELRSQEPTLCMKV